MKKIITIILTLGIILRLVLAFTTYHPDVAAFDFAGKVISQGNIANFYDYLWKLPEDHPYLKIYPRYLFNYPPLPYFLLGGVSRLTTWMVSPSVHNDFTLNFPSTLGNIQLNFLLLLLKLPYLPFDIAIAFLLMSLVKDKKKKLWLFAIWMFNPVNLYATYMMGQFDIIPTFLTVAALYLVAKKAEPIADKDTIVPAILLGLGAAFKIFPILFIVPLALLSKNWWGRIKTASAGFATYILAAYPFIFSKGFRATAMLANQTTKSLYAQIPISGGESIIIFLAVVIFFYLVFLYRRTSAANLWQRFFIMMLVFFTFTHYHPQWFLWITPFFIIDLVITDFKHLLPLIICFVSFVILTTFFDPGLTVWLFAPVNPALWGLPGIWQQLGMNLDVNFLRSLFQTVFVGSALYYLYANFPKEQQ